MWLSLLLLASQTRSSAILPNERSIASRHHHRIARGCRQTFQSESLLLAKATRKHISKYRLRLQVTSDATTHLQKLSSAVRAHLDELLDEALEETFPASDPIAITVEPKTAEDKSSGQRTSKGSERGAHAQVSRQLRSAPETQA
jgi:hypothetical protein